MGASSLSSFLVSLPEFGESVAIANEFGTDRRELPEEELVLALIDCYRLEGWAGTCKLVFLGIPRVVSVALIPRTGRQFLGAFGCWP